jgi:hypothetical protein
MQLTEPEIRRWLWLRAVEWKGWPTFVSQPVIPVLFIFYPWFWVLGGLFFLNVLWAGLRYRYINVAAVTNAVYFVSFCKWPTAIVSAAYLFLHRSYLAGSLTVAWPLGLCGLITVPGQTGRIELMLAKKIGYVE